MYKVLCTICARKGSKGLPNKNKKLLLGKPLIRYSIERAKECEMIDLIAVSSNDNEIKELSYRDTIIIDRPDDISTDDSPKIEAIRHAVKEIEKYMKFDIVIDLSVVSPLRSVDDIENSIKLLIDTKASNVFSVSPPYRNPYFNMVEVIDNKVKLIKNPPRKIFRRQDAPNVYDMNDSMHIWWRDTLFSNDSIFNDDTKIYCMPRERGIDIDDALDFEIVSYLMNKNV